MRLAELSERAGVPRSTIKFYIREGLLSPGAVHARNQASYGSQHVERLALIRALREVAGLPLEVVARVTKELDRGWEGDPFAEAMLALSAPPAAPPAGAAERRRATEEVRAFLRGLPWTTAHTRYYFADELAAALVAVRRWLYPDFPVAALAKYAQLAWLLSEVEFDLAPGGARVPLRARGDDVAEPTRRAILSSVLFERIFSALRRCANSMRSIRLATGTRVPAARAPGLRRARRR
ncbi:MAG TPA: MerR family transcriptional regulator [Myxococcota bacterium]|nr:MerR family transcriptional regulator [Myxococcota bacterium]